MRIGLLCPYSVTIPGGVQGQVLGLARALRELGHPTRVLAPSDGVPPDAGVTPLGVSVPTAANGSVAPLAPDPSAQLRTIRAIRDEGFDVLHLHEPLAPGPTMTALVVKAVPMVGTFHAAGDSASYKYAAPALRWLLSRLGHRVAVSPDAASLAQGYLGGDYELLHNGIELDRYGTGPATPTDGPTVFFCGRHEPRKGLAVLLEALASGLPVAAYPVPGPLDVIGETPVGVLSEDLADAVKKALVIDPALCRKHAEAYSWDASIDQFLGNLYPFRGAHAVNPAA